MPKQVVKNKGEKPPVLSEEELREQIALEVHDWHCPDEKGVVETYWTGPSMQDYLECADVILPYIQQAKVEVAREIFEEIGKSASHLQEPVEVAFYFYKKDWQSLKDKFLKPKEGDKNDR